jgi:hypothetical protein
VQVVVGAELRRGGLVLEIEEERGRIEEGDGGDAKGHGVILVIKSKHFCGIERFVRAAIGCGGILELTV